MSEFKGKKGPWSWVGGVLCNESYIVGRFESPPSSEDKALIAAAPDLFEALRGLIALYEHDEGCRQTQEYKRAKAAMAKALGQ